MAEAAGLAQQKARVLPVEHVLLFVLQLFQTAKELNLSEKVGQTFFLVFGHEVVIRVHVLVLMLRRRLSALLEHRVEVQQAWIEYFVLIVDFKRTGFKLMCLLRLFLLELLVRGFLDFELKGFEFQLFDWLRSASKFYFGFVVFNFKSDRFFT